MFYRRIEVLESDETSVPKPTKSVKRRQKQWKHRNTGIDFTDSDTDIVLESEDEDEDDITDYARVRVHLRLPGHAPRKRFTTREWGIEPAEQVCIYHFSNRLKFTTEPGKDSPWKFCDPYNVLYKTPSQLR
jgi:hypothetical protein